MPIQANDFYKGDNRDLDLLRLPQDTARRIKNMRILDVDGKGLVLTNVGGNELRFNLTRGFIPVGKCEYNGIGYIASVNPTTGQGELGCYPAPLPLLNQNSSQSGFGPVKAYAPLFNFTGGNISRDAASLSQPFRTTLFDFNCENQIDMFAREDYDGSVNLYLAQKGNPIRVYNTGFDQKGSLTSIGRRYWNGSFPNAVNLMNESEKHIDIQFQGLGKAGSLRSGNWFFFIRYSTENFDKTSFFSETNSIQITEGSYASEGIRHHGLIGGQKTDKSVNLSFSNIDTTYSYIEVGYMYAFNDTFEYGIIDKLYPIDPNMSTMNIEITGYEGYFETGFEEIIRSKPKYNGATSHVQLENRYFASNVFDTTKYDNDSVKDLLSFAKNITCKFDDNFGIAHKAGSTQLGIYNNEYNVYNYTGYFRGEAYSFAVVFVLKNGRETQAFPITGSDDFNGVSTSTNQSGVYRFPNINSSPTVIANTVKVMGVKFDISAALASLPQYVQDEIEGLYFVRSKRNETLLYQGLNLPCYNAAKGDDIRGLWFALPDFPQVLKRNENYVPMFELYGNDPQGAAFPYIHRFDANDLFDQEFTFVSWHRNLNKRIENKWGFFSPDHFFNKTVGITKGYIFPFAQMNFGVFQNTDASKPDYYYRDDNYSYTIINKRIEDLSNIKEWEPANNNGFSSYFDEGAKSSFNSNFYFFAENLLNTKYFEIRSHAMAFNSYIGIDSQLPLRHTLANIYKSDVTPGVFDIEDLYDVKSTNYYKISKFYKISDLLANPSIVNNNVFYKGDCFLQRTWLKQMFNPKYGVGVKDDGGGVIGWTPPLLSSFADRLFTYGTSFSIITENKINTEMRLENAVNKFYPGSTSDVYDFAVKNIEKESDDLNRGYNEVVSIKSYRGIDVEIPFVPSAKHAAIIYSNKHVLGSFQDGYRLIDANAIREYDYRLGKIVRLVVLNNILCSIQEYGINRHYVNEKAVLNSGASAGELLLGTGDILDPKHLNMNDFVGSQHMWSIVATEKAIYGVDYNKRKLWRIIQAQGQLGVELTSDVFGYRSLIHELCEKNSMDSDITETLPDNPVCLGGIVGHYDRKFNEVYFTWVYGPGQNDPCKPFSNGRSIVFNEWMNAFYGERTLISGMYFSVNEDFMVFNPSIFPSLNQFISQNGDAWMQDINFIAGQENWTTFFGQVDPEISYVEFVVKEPADIVKAFDNYHISSSSDDLYKAVYETQNQISEHFPWYVGDEVNFWRDPKYEENLWRVPIIRTQQTQDPVNNIYEVDSRIRGRWLKIRLEYKTKSNIFIKSVLTAFRESKQ